MKSKANLVIVKSSNVMENAQYSSKMDKLKWAFVFILLGVAIVGNYYLAELMMPLRMLLSIVVFSVAALVAVKTKKGALALNFIRDARAELRKVIWPTKDETLQTTLIVAVMVIILAVLLWGMDGVLVWLIGWLTGQHV